MADGTQVGFDIRIWAPEREGETRLLERMAALSGEPGPQDTREFEVVVNGEVRPSFLHGVLTSPSVARALRSRRLVITGARLAQPLDLCFARLPFALTLRGCTCAEKLVLHHARCVHLTLAGGGYAAIEANGIEITGDLDLRDGVCVWSLSIERACIYGSLRLNGARLGYPCPDLSAPAEEASRAALPPPPEAALLANDIDVRGTVEMQELRARGVVSFERGRIRGDLSCEGARFHNPGAKAFEGNLLRVHGSISLDRVRARGEVIMLNAECRANLQCIRALLGNPTGDALSLDRLSVRGSVFLHRLHAFGGVRVPGAEIGLDLDCHGARMYGVDPAAAEQLQAAEAGPKESAEAGQDPAADTPPHPASEGAHDQPAVGSDGGAAAQAADEEKEPPALAASRMRVQGNVYFNDFACRGRLVLEGARVSGRLLFKQTRLALHRPTPADEPRGACCLDAEGISVRGSVELSDLHTNSLFDFRSARVGQNLRVRTLRFCETGKITGLLLENAVVQGEFSWLDAPADEGTKLVLSHARIGRLRHGRKSWPHAGRLQIDGCVYKTLDFEEPGSADAAAPGAPPPPAETRQVPPGEEPWFARLIPGAREKVRAAATRAVRIAHPAWGEFPAPDSQTWLELQGTGFDSQTYEQLCAVRRHEGNDAEAKQIAVAREKAEVARAMESAKAGHGGLDPLALKLRRALGFVVEYGHSTRRLWVLALAWVFAAAFWFGQAKHAGVMSTANEEVFLDPSYVRSHHEPPEYPRFNAVMYSADAFLPIIDLHQESYWLPSAKQACRLEGTEWRNPVCGGLFRLFLWVHIVVGWLATTVMVFSISGLMRRSPSD